jgi:small neutral amino acid transporter SnatA (MarC family)
MNKAVRTFIIMGIILIIVFAIGRYANWGWSDGAMWLAGGMFVIAFGIRFLGYLIRNDKLRKKTS